MKRILYSILALSSLSLIFSSCEDDGTGGGGGGVFFNTPPSLTAVSGENLISDNATVAPNSVFTVRLDAVSGDADMNDITVTLDGINIDQSTFLVDGVGAAANPVLLFDEDRTSFTWDFTFTAPDTESFFDYTFEVRDDNQETAVVSIFISTEPEGPVSAGDDPPTVSIGGSGDFDVSANGLIDVQVIASPGDNPIASIAVLEDGVLMDVSRLEYDGIPFDVNPFSIPEADGIGFGKDITLRAPNATGVFNYEVILSDAFGNSTSDFFTISTGPTGEPVTLLEGRLFNASGPTGTGGLDLDSGTGTGSADPLAEIRDEGSDFALPDGENWIQRIAGVNGVELRSLFPGSNDLSENFTFESIEVQEQIADLWENSFEFVEGSTNGDYLISFFVDPGDIFIAQKGDTFYSFIVREVNVTAGNNDDNYIVDIKF